jgi:hypothetical protein
MKMCKIGFQIALVEHVRGEARSTFNVLSMSYRPGYWTTYGVENEPRRFQLLSGGALLISHFRIYEFFPNEVPVINNNRDEDLF